MKHIKTITEMSSGNFGYVMSMLNSVQVEKDIQYIVDRITDFEDDGRKVYIDICYKRIDYYEVLVSDRYETGSTHRGTYNQNLQRSEKNIDLMAEYADAFKKSHICYDVNFGGNISDEVYNKLAKRFGDRVIKPSTIFDDKVGVVIKCGF